MKTGAKIKRASLAAALAASPFVLAACGLKSNEPYDGPGKLPGTWHHEVAGFSDFPRTVTYEFLDDGTLRFRLEKRSLPSDSWAGKWELRNDSLFATKDSCGTNPDTQAAIHDCRLPSGYDVGWLPAAERVYQLTDDGPLFLNYRR